MQLTDIVVRGRVNGCLCNDLPKMELSWEYIGKH